MKPQPTHRRKAPKDSTLYLGVLSSTGRTLTFYCPNCRGHHHHGWNPADPIWAITHRGSHCHALGAPSGYHIGVSRELSTAP